MRSSRQFVAVLGCLVAAGGLSLVGAPPAAAAAAAASGGSLQWGLKETLLNYHLRHSGSTQDAVAADGATPSSETRQVGALGTSPAQTYPAFWNFPFKCGVYDSATNSFTAQYGGSVTLTDSDGGASTGPTGSSPFKAFKFSNPAVVIDLDTGRKQLVVDMSPGDDGDPATPVDPVSTGVDFATFSELTTEAVDSGGTVSYSNLETELTAAGAAAFGGFYNAGDPVDTVSASLTGIGSGGTPNCTVTIGAPPSSSSNPNAPTTTTTTGQTDTSNTTTGSSTSNTPASGTTSSGNGFVSAGPPPPPQGGWFGPPMGRPGMGQPGMAQPGMNQPMVGGSQYNPPPWFRPPPPPGYGMPPPGFVPQQQFQAPQFQQQYAAPPQAPVASSQVAAPAATAPPATQVASTTTLPTRSPRPIPRATGPADGELVDVAATDVAGSEQIGVAMFAVVLGIGGLIAYFTSRGVRDAIAVRANRSRPGRR
ncbi:MAG: HtaA domain-containing protein [Sporichthyaceae bacterium]